MTAPLYSELSYLNDPMYGNYGSGVDVYGVATPTPAEKTNLTGVHKGQQLSQDILGDGSLPMAKQAAPSGVAEPAPFNADAIANANPDLGTGGDFPETQITPAQRTISPYDDGGPSGASKAGGYMDTAGNTALAAAPATGPAAPYVAAGGLILKGAGTVASIYGKYKDREEAKERYENVLDQWNKSEAERKADKIREAARADRQEAYFAADYAKDTTDYFANSYSGQRTPGGQ